MNNTVSFYTHSLDQVIKRLRQTPMLVLALFGTFLFLSIDSADLVFAVTTPPGGTPPPATGTGSGLVQIAIDLVEGFCEPLGGFIVAARLFSGIAAVIAIVVFGLKKAGSAVMPSFAGGGGMMAIIGSLVVAVIFLRFYKSIANIFIGSGQYSGTGGTVITGIDDICVTNLLP